MTDSRSAARALRTVSDSLQGLAALLELGELDQAEALYRQLQHGFAAAEPPHWGQVAAALDQAVQPLLGQAGSTAALHQAYAGAGVKKPLN